MTRVTDVKYRFEAWPFFFSSVDVDGPAPALDELSYDDVSDEGPLAKIVSRLTMLMAFSGPLTTSAFCSTCPSQSSISGKRIPRRPRTSTTTALATLFRIF